jgi:UDP-N-acetylglucosamine transferase subunit ALG13
VNLVDEAAARCGATVLIQTGFTKARPSCCDAVDFLGRDEFERRVAAADYVVTHAGEGSVIEVLRNGKTPIVVARRSALGEHVNDHQVQLVTEFQALGLADAVESVDDLVARLRAAPAPPPDEKSKFSNTELLRHVERFLEA